MRFITITLIVHAPDPVTGEQKSTQDRFREVLESARLAEELGFDGFGVGERHERPFISSAPTVMLSHVAAQRDLFHVTPEDQWDRNAVPAPAIAAAG